MSEFESLYPFLYSDTSDLSAVLAQVRASTVAKAEEILELRRAVAIGETMELRPYFEWRGMVAVVPGEEADRAVAALRAHPLGEQAAVIGHVRAEQPGIVQLKTAFGGTRIVDLLVGDPLPRIC